MAVAVLSGCVRAKAPDQTLSVDGQSVLLHASAATAKRPLVLALHGLGSTGAEFSADSGLEDYADQKGFVVAFPNAHPAPRMPQPVRGPAGTTVKQPDGSPAAWPNGWMDEARLQPQLSALALRPNQQTQPPTASIGRAWNAGICCGGATADDVTYLRHVITAVSHRVAVDRHRVYVVGFSNGGMMALRAICDAPDVFAAAASVDGPYLGSECSRPVWDHLHDLNDRIVPYRGGTSPGSPWLHVAEDWCGCAFPDSATESSRFASKNVALTVSRTGGHTWPRPHDGTWNVNADDIIWRYLDRYRL
jgi:poly(3-hydroxybutyrate) depolymerase